MLSIVVKIAGGFAMLVAVLSGLSAQDIRDSWNPGFTIPGVASDVWAVATEGESIVVLTKQGVQIFRNGQWSPPIALPPPGWQALEPEFWPVRNVALYKGDPWLVGDSLAYHFNAGVWKRIALPPHLRHVTYQTELVVSDSELYLTPDIHMWTDLGWKRILPECFAYVGEAVVSASGDWLILGIGEECGSGVLWLLEDGLLRSIDSTGLEVILEYEPSLAFDGDAPVVYRHRYVDGVWEELVYPDEWSPTDSKHEIFSNIGGEPLYAIAPGWETRFPSSGNISHGRPCSTRLYRLYDREWRAVSGWFDNSVMGLAPRTGGGVVLAGGFLSDRENVVASRIAGYSGTTWETYGDPRSTRYSGLVGRVNDVAIQGDTVWVCGDRLFAAGLSESATLLYRTDGSWQRVDGIDGEATMLEVYNGDLYVAGNLELDSGDETALARLGAGEWTILGDAPDNVGCLYAHDSSLYFSSTDWSDRRDPRSSVHYLRGESVRLLFGDWSGVVQTMEIANDIVYFGDKSGQLAQFNGGRLTRLATATGDRFHFLSNDQRRIQRASVQSLLWYDGWLYVGGEFDSIGSIAAGNIARFNGASWESLDSGVARSDGYFSEPCGSAVIDRVSSLHVVDHEILAAGSFSSIGTHSKLALRGGDEVSVPIAVYNLSERRWRAATHFDSTRRYDQAEVRGVDVDRDRIAIAGDFVVPGIRESWNVAITDDILTVGNFDRSRAPQDVPFSVVYLAGGLQLESTQLLSVVVEIFDITGRLIERPFNGEVVPGVHRIVPRSLLANQSYVVTATDRLGRTTSIVVPLN